MRRYRFHKSRIVVIDTPNNQHQKKETNVSEKIAKSCHIGMGQRLRLFDWLRAKKEELQRDKPQYNDCAARITQELGFEINRNILASALKTLEWKWIPHRSGKSIGAKQRNREMIRILQKQVAQLRQAMFNLCERIGENPPSMIGFDEWPKLAEIEPPKED